MKIIQKYVLREHAGPLVFALSALTSIMLLNYVAKQLGNLVGKGLPWTAILEFFVLSLPFTVAMTLPMAVLVAVLYAFSRLAAENEITALKANGVSMTRLLMPVLIGGALLSLLMIAFNDQILPRTNHRLRTLQGDIARKKPTFALREQVLNEIPGSLFLRTNHLDRATNRLRDVTIFDLSDPMRRRTIYADSGVMAFASNGSDLQLTLYHGFMQEVPKETRTQLQRLYYQVDYVRVAGVADQFQRDSADTFKSDREMSVCELQNEVARHERDYFGAWDDYRRAADASKRGASALIELKQRPTSMPGALAPRSRVRSLGRTYCDALGRLERLGVGAFTKIAVGRALTLAEPRAAFAMGVVTSDGAGQPQARDTIRPPARDTIRPARDTTGQRSRDTTKQQPRDTVAKQPRDTVAKQQRDTLRSRADSSRHTADSARVVTDTTHGLKQDSAAVTGAGTPAAGTPPGAVTRPPTPVPQPLPPGVQIINGDTVYPGNTTAVAPAAAAAASPEGIVPNATTGVAPSTGANATIPASVVMENARNTMLTERNQMNQYAVEIHKKFAISLACIVFVLLGAPIALRFPRGGVGVVIGVSLIVFGLYYVGLIAGEALGDRGILSPALAMQSANVVLTITSFFLLARMGRETTTARGGNLSELLDSIRGWRPARLLGLGRRERRA